MQRGIKITKSSNDYFSRCYKGVAPQYEGSDWDPSSLLMEQMDGNPIDFTDLNNEEKLCWIYKFHLDLLFLEQAGWVCHTCDWDPYLEIHLVDGEIWETESGYYDIEIKGLRAAQRKLGGGIDDLMNQRSQDKYPNVPHGIDDITIIVTSCKDSSDDQFVREILLTTIKSIQIHNQ